MPGICFKVIQGIILLLSKAAVPNLFGTRDLRQFFHGLGRGDDGSGGNASNGER